MATTASNPAGKASAVGGTGKIAPEILWAQRSSADEPEKNLVMLTINVPNLTSESTTLNLTKDGFHFSAKAGNQAKGIEEKDYEFKLDFFDQIDVENSKKSQTSKSLYLVLRKAEAKEEFWPRLTKEKVRLHNVKTDFDKWVDEDEQEGDIEDVTAGMGGMGGMDPSMLGMGGGMGAGMPGGAGGMGGMDLQAMMSQMNQGGAGGMDLQSMMSQMGNLGGMPGGGMGMGGSPGDEDDEDDEDEDGPKFDATPDNLTEAEREVDSID